MPVSPPDRILNDPARDGPEPAHAARRSIDVKVLLLLLPLLVAVPVLAYGGFLLYVTAEQAADHARREQAAAHDALQAALRRELEQTQQFLSAIAGSPSLSEAAEDATRAAPFAERIVNAGLGIRTLVVLGRDGAVVLEYPRRVEGARTVRLAPHQIRSFETGESIVSDLHESPVDGRLSVSIDVPVVRGGRVPWIITALLDPVQLSRTLAAQVGPRDAMSTVLDSRRRIVARTRDLPRWYGELPSRETLQALDSGDRGWQRFRTRDGNEYLWTWSTIPTGWTVWLGSPAREFDDALRNSMLRLAGAGVGLLLLGMAGTALVARRIAASADRMTENARRLTEGERPAYRPSGIRQLDTLYQALEDASDRVSRALDAERAARAAADEHNRSKDLFLGMLSHELRNPLAPIRNSLYILGHAEANGPQARRAKEIANRQLAHMTRLVDDLLDVTRIARGKIELRPGELDLARLARRTAEDHRPLMHERHLDLTVHVPERPVVVSGDETRVAQVLGNLLHNAAKFTPAGGRVTLAVAEEDGNAVIHVRDTGAGIDSETMATIFEPFTQAKQTLARSEGGLGLGLALVKGLVALHGGDVTAFSAGPGRGTDFVITLPLATAHAASPREQVEPRPARHARRRVLVIDDNRDAADSLAEIVSMLGHTAVVAYDALEGLATTAEDPPDVVLCDIGLPGMDGYEFARQFRARAGKRRVHLVAISGYAQPEDVARAADAGFDAHIAKPCDPEQIERLLA